MGINPKKLMWVSIRERKMPEGKTEIVPKSALNFFDDWLNFAAKRTFIISVFQQCNRRVNRALKVIAFRVRQLEIHLVDHLAFIIAGTVCLFRKSFNAERIPSAPGLTPTGETKLQ